MDRKNDNTETTIPLLQGTSRSAGPSSPILPQYQANLLDDLPAVPEADNSTRHGSIQHQQIQREDIYAASSPARTQSVPGNQQSARQWHRSILQRAETARSNGGQPPWANVVPLSLLGRWAAVVECPLCKELTRTTLRHETGKGTHWMATLLFFTTAVGAFIPYVTDFSKNVRHSCLKCGSTLATNHFGSGTEAHLI
ncbi:hypothetical protein KVR01_012970 [Diaporthe batatas]|uniref:uncharacterized protein n=1 Tax=Diaporthe batatas TaxID=748121 RepID=UPI001D0555BB|nr:uncharacterized protein KVR01_012970 [Diaporthe batatas]KAG8157262.1 hypothetical protein KVR01_012970 [Diaporthe batatas]